MADWKEFVKKAQVDFGPLAATYGMGAADMNVGHAVTSNLKAHGVPLSSPPVEMAWEKEKEKAKKALKMPLRVASGTAGALDGIWLGAGETDDTYGWNVFHPNWARDSWRNMSRGASLGWKEGFNEDNSDYAWSEVGRAGGNFLHNLVPGLIHPVSSTAASGLYDLIDKTPVGALNRLATDYRDRERAAYLTRLYGEDFVSDYYNGLIGKDDYRKQQIDDMDERIFWPELGLNFLLGSKLLGKPTAWAFDKVSKGIGLSGASKIPYIRKAVPYIPPAAYATSMAARQYAGMKREDLFKEKLSRYIADYLHDHPQVNGGESDETKQQGVVHDQQEVKQQPVAQSVTFSEDDKSRIDSLRDDLLWIMKEEKNTSDPVRKAELQAQFKQGAALWNDIISGKIKASDRIPLRRDGNSGQNGQAEEDSLVPDID